MTQKHTKAPWIIQNGTSIEAPDYGWEGLEICQITGIDHKSELPCNNAEEVNRANARLIAAAPELLAALKALMQHAGIDENDLASLAAPNAFKQACDAINLAEGKA